MGAGTRTVAARSVKLAKRSVSTVELRFDAKAVAALRDAGGRATIKLALRRGGGRKTSARGTLTLRLPSAAPQARAPGPAGGGATPAPSGGGTTGTPAPPA